jgi:hypothetical protein
VVVGGTVVVVGGTVVVVGGTVVVVGGTVVVAEELTVNPTMFEKTGLFEPELLELTALYWLL